MMTDEERKAPLLMGAHHPNGWKLDDLMVKLRHEIHIKQARIKDDPRKVAALVRANNEKLLDLFRQAEAINKESMAALATSIGPDQGPQGAPRIGDGTGPGTNTGHGHVWPRPDGVKARCGGPGMCMTCTADAQRYAPNDR